MMNPSYKQSDIGSHPINSSGEINRDEIRQKMRSEMNRPRYSQPEQYGRDFGLPSVPGGQYTKSDYYHSQPIPPNFRDPYGYGMQRMPSMHPSLSRSSSGMGMIERQLSSREIYNSSAPLQHSNDQKYEKHYVGNERMVPDQIQANNEYKQAYYNQAQGQNTDQSSFISKSFLMNLLFDNTKKSPYSRRLGKEAKKLANMRKLHNIKKFKNIYKWLRDCLNKEREMIESELGASNIAREMQQLIKNNDQQSISAPSSLPPQTQQTSQSQPMFTTQINDFNSEEEVDRPRKIRKDSDESFDDSQFSTRNKKSRPGIQIDKFIPNSQPIAQNISKLKERRQK